MDADIIVVGAGPAGSTTAALAARAGARVLLLDRAHFPRQKACAEYMSPGVMDVLNRTGLAAPVLERCPLPVPGMDIVSASGARFRLRYRRDGEAVQAMTLPRVELDHALAAQAVAEGAQLEEGVIVREPIEWDGAVQGVKASVGGRALRLHARLVVIADGARSSVRQAMGLSRPVRWPHRMGLVAHFAGSAISPGGFGQMHVASGGYCGLAPLPGGGVNVGLVIHTPVSGGPRTAPSRVLDDWIAEHQSLAASLSGFTRISPVRGMLPVGARSRRDAGPGFLLVGDAAGFFDPFTGEGIHRALVGGEIAARTALAALAHGFRLDAIRHYHRARRNAFANKEIVTMLVQAFVRFPHLLDYAVPRLETRPGAGELLASVLGDIADPARFLRPSPLWEALRP